MLYKEYEVKKLFKSANGNIDLKKEHITGKGVPVITSGVDKDGILGLTDVPAKILPSHTLTIDMFGNAFYRPFEYKMVTHARVFSLQLLGHEMTDEIGLYLTSCFHWLPKAFNYNNMCSFAKIRELTITLPVQVGDDGEPVLDPDCKYHVDGFIPDWGYMRERIAELERERIAELERERIAELEQYLVATGLNDYELTKEDIETLSLSLVSGITKNEVVKMLLRFAKSSK